eukprot:gene4540-6410_t
MSSTNLLNLDNAQVFSQQEEDQRPTKSTKSNIWYWYCTPTAKQFLSLQIDRNSSYVDHINYRDNPMRNKSLEHNSVNNQIKQAYRSPNKHHQYQNVSTFKRNFSATENDNIVEVKVIPHAVVDDSVRSIPAFSINVKETNQHDSQNKEAQPLSYNKILNRFLLCLFSLSLLWSTSLQLCVALVDMYITIPPLAAVIKTCNYSYKQIKVQQNDYKRCVKIQLNSCNKYFQKSYVTEMTRCSAANDDNQLFLNNFNMIVTNASSTYLQSKLAFKSWTNIDIDYTIPYYDNCTGLTKEYVINLLSDTSTTKVATYSTSTSYVTNSDSTITRLADYSVELSDYNYKYISNKTQHLQSLILSVVNEISLPHMKSINVSFAPMYDMADQLVGCLSLNNNTENLCPLSVNTYDIYDTLRTVINHRLEIISETFTEITTTYDEFAADVITSIDAADSFYESVSGATGIINYIINTFSIVSIKKALCGKSTPNWCDYDILSWYLTPPSLPDTPTIPTLEDASYIWNQVKSIRVDANLNISLSAKKLSNALESLLQDLLDGIEDVDFSLSDYNPPSYQYATNASEEAKNQHENSQTFLDDLKSILQGANSTLKATNSNLLKNQNISSGSFKSGVSSSFKLTCLNTIAYNYASLEGNTLLSNGINDYNAESLNECSYSYSSSKSKYENILSQLLTSNSSLASIGSDSQQILSCVNTPLLNNRFINACCGLNDYYLNYNYCSHANYTCPVSSEGAYYKPPGVYLTNIMNYNNHSNGVYLKYKLNNNDNKNISSDDNNSNNNDVGLLYNNDNSLINSIFQCDALSECIITCSGPDKVLVRAVTKACACMSEWLLNGNIMQICVALLVFSLVNLSRLLICRGLLKICWKSLTYKLFEVSIHCDSEGNIQSDKTVMKNNLHQINVCVNEEEVIQANKHEMKRRIDYTKL